MTPVTPIRVDVWSDVQCIWCYISNSRLHTAIERHPGHIEVEYHSFQLSPEADVDIDRDAHIRSHNVDPARMQQIMAQLARLTAQEGLPYHPNLTQPTNSHQALELLHHAGKLGRRPELTQRLFEAYFAEGRHIGHVDELLALAGEVGLDRDTAAAVLADRRYAAAVDNDMRHALQLGAQGVPFYVINNSVSLSGAQPEENLLAAFDHARRP